uniref:Putative s-phase kinase-associated protein 2 n=1 Tax=Amblyomma aureolatum TaxID=187763 RepID=A0A1E1XDG1_9ACAR
MDHKVVPLDYSNNGSKKRSPLQDITTNQPSGKRHRHNTKHSETTATAETDIENVIVIDDSDDSASREKWGVDNRVPSDILDDMGIAYLDDESPQSSLASADPPPPPRASRKYSKGQKRDVPSELSGTPPSRTAADDFTLHKRSKPESSDGKDPFMDLSDETILEVFKWLPKSVLISCGRVCRRWMRLAFDESLWRRLDLGKKHLGPGVLGNVLSRGVTVLRLATADVKTPFCDGAPLLCCPDSKSSIMCKVQYLDLSMASISRSALCQLFARCTQLKKLSLEQCTVDDKICRLIGANQDLETLNMCLTTGITPIGIAHICKGCTSLTALNLSWSGMKRACLDSFVLTVTPKLRELNISGCHTELRNGHVSALVKRCPQLVELDLSDAADISCEAIHAIVNGLSNLKHLGLSRCYNIVPTTFLTLSKMESLQQLELFGVLGDTALQAVRKRLPQLDINKQLFSTVARPTTGIRRTSIWGMKVRD